MNKNTATKNKEISFIINRHWVRIKKIGYLKLIKANIVMFIYK